MGWFPCMQTAATLQNNHNSRPFHIRALHLFNLPLLPKFPTRPNQASCSIGAPHPVPESHGGIVRFSAALTAQLTVTPVQDSCCPALTNPTMKNASSC